MQYKKIVKSVLRFFNCVGLWHWHEIPGEIVRGIKIYGEDSNLKRVVKVINILEAVENSIRGEQTRRTNSRAKHKEALDNPVNYVEKMRHLKALKKPLPNEYASLTRKTTIEEIYKFIKLELKRNPNVDNNSSELVTLREFFNKEIIKSNFFKHKTLIR